MSIQPILTSSFSTFALSRTLNAGRAEAAARQAENAMSEVEANAVNGAFPTERVERAEGVSSRQDVPGAEKSTRDYLDRDFGKPRSASGDVLDLSSFQSQPGGAPRETTVSGTEGAFGTRSTEASPPQAGVDSVSVAGTSRETGTTDASSLQDRGVADRQATREVNTSEDAKVASETKKLTPEEQEQVDKLKARDREVRTHEAAHLAAAGAYAQGAASFTFQTGPDGKKYAVGGEVSIDASPVSGDPEATIAKMQQVRAAALAPASPSSQDMKVAAAASQTEAEARMQISQERSDAAFGAAESENADGSKTAGMETGGVVQASNDATVQVGATGSADTTSADSSSTDKAERNRDDGLFGSFNGASKSGQSIENGLNAAVTVTIPTVDLGKGVADAGRTAQQRKDNTASIYLANSRLASNTRPARADFYA